MSTELAWAAGFFDGEGSIGTIKRDGTLHFQIGQLDPRPLDRFVNAIEAGEVSGPYGPYASQLTNKPVYKVRLYGEKARTAMEKLLPYLSEPKREKYAEALSG